jgi:MGT family glycosyltransferase
MRYAFVVPPLTGHVNPTLGLGAELLSRGHDVAWISPDDSLADSLPAGGELLLVREEMAEDQVVSISQKNVYGVESIKFLYDEVLIPLNRYMAAGVEAYIDSWRPDVIVNDHQLFAGAIAACKKNIPYVTSVTAPAAIKMREDLPGVHEWEVQRMVALQQELGIGGSACIACSDTMALLFTSREFFGEMELPEHYQFVGPVIRKPAVAGARGGFDWERFESWVGRPRILVTIGTTFDHNDKKAFFQKIVAAFGGTEIGVVVVSDVNLLDSWPENFLVQQRVPQLDLLGRLDAVVCHGGHNTVCETLLFGLPLVVVPIAYDQSHVASRVVQAGAGVRLNFRRCKAIDLRAAVNVALSLPDYRLAAGRIRESFRAAGGVERAAGLLETINQ